MAWDWDKLKQKQQGPGGGVPPGVDEVVQKLKKVKLPGGWIITAQVKSWTIQNHVMRTNPVKRSMPWAY